MSTFRGFPASIYDGYDWPARSDASASGEKGKGKGLHGKGMFRGKLAMSDPVMQGPAPVPDDDGLEHVLVHVIGVSGEWLWSSVVHEHTNMYRLQNIFHDADGGKFGLVDGHKFILVWEYGQKGPYPPGSARRMRNHDLPCFSVQDHLEGVIGIERSTETREVWITAVKTRLG